MRRRAFAVACAALLLAAFSPNAVKTVSAAPWYFSCIPSLDTPGSIEFQAGDPGWLDSDGYRFEGAQMTWTVTGPDVDQVLYGPGPMGDITGLVWGLSDGETYMITYTEYVPGESGFEEQTCTVTAEGESGDAFGWSVSEVNDSYARPPGVDPPSATEPPPFSFSDCYQSPWFCEGILWDNPSEMRIAVIQVRFKGGPSTAASLNKISDVFFNSPDIDGVDRSVARYMHDASYGKVTVSGTVFPPVKIDAYRSDCDSYQSVEPPYLIGSEEWTMKAREQLEALGTDLSSYTHFYYVWPRANCSDGGKGRLRAGWAWINGWPSRAHYVVTHELGHNLGIAHASLTRCTLGGRRVALGGTCKYTEYGNKFDLMGSGYLLGVYERMIAGWIEDDELPQYEAPGVYELTLNPVEYSESAVKGARVVRPLQNPRPDGKYPSKAFNGRELCLEWHRPYGPFKNVNQFYARNILADGLMIQVCDGKTLLVDAHPKTGRLRDATLRVGETLVDQFSGIRVTVLSKTLNASNPGLSEMRVRVVIP